MSSKPLPRRPGPACGATSRRTIEIRGPSPLTEHERKLAKGLREEGLDFAAVAARLSRTEAEVRQGLANVRSRRPNPPRATVNVSPAAIEILNSLREPDEPMWRTVNRILGIGASS